MGTSFRILYEPFMCKIFKTKEIFKFSGPLFSNFQIQSKTSNRKELEAKRTQRAEQEEIQCSYKSLKTILKIAIHDSL